VALTTLSPTCSLPWWRGDHHQGPGAPFVRCAGRIFQSGNGRVSQVPGEPQRTRAPLNDPGGSETSGQFRRLRSADACVHCAGTPRLRAFRGSVTRLTCSLSTLDAQVTLARPRLASGCWPGFAGRDWLPAGFQRTVSSYGHAISILHSQSCPRRAGSLSPRTGLAAVLSHRRWRPQLSAMKT
jgi:hypothetical protein